MPHVATDTKTYTLKPAQPQPARTTQASDRPQGEFESMIDDNAASTSAAREQTAAERAQDRTPDKPKAKPSKSASDSKPAANDAPAKADPADKTAKSGDAGNTDATEKSATGTKTDEAATDTAKADPAATTDKTDPAAAVPGTLTMPDGTLAVALPVQMPTPAEAQPATAAAAEDAQAPAIAALAGQAQGAMDPNAVQGKDGKPSKDKPAETAKPAEGGELAGKQPTEAQAANSKAAQVPQSDADIEHIARARGEADESPRHAVKEAAHTDTEAPAPKVTTDLPTPQPQAPTQSAPTTAASAAATAAAPQAAVQTPVPLAGVPVEIAAKAREGKNNFDIRLDPAELGRIEVRLNIDRNGNVTSHLIADRQDTLDLLKRDSSGLERALQDAGLKTSDNAMQFSLRDQSLSQQQDNGKNTGGQTARVVAQDDTLPIIDTPVQSYGRLVGRGGGLDIRV